jgi:hypothetical protein
MNVPFFLFLMYQYGETVTATTGEDGVLNPLRHPLTP